MTAGAEAHPAWLADASPDDMRRIIDALYRVHRLIGAMTDAHALLEQIMEESKALTGAEACSLMLYDAKTNQLFFQVALGASGDQHTLLQVIRLDMGQGIAGQAAQTRASINVPDASADPRFFKEADRRTKFETRAILAVPLLDRADLVGVVEVLNKQGGGAFDEIDLRVLEMFSGAAAPAIVNARLIEENLRAERMTAIGHAVAHMSHYAKNVMTGMRASVDLIDKGIAEGNDALFQTGWPVLKRSVRKIGVVVEDMLAYSKERTPMKRPAELRAVIEEAAESFWGLSAQRRFTLTVDVEGVAGPVWLEAHGIYRCLLNLLGNAADAVPEGAGTVRIAAWTQDDGALIIEVADNGPGIAAENAAQVFEPFFSTKGSKGTGLGLAVSHKIVKEHGGRITVEGAPEGGALFRIVLPDAMRGEIEP